VRLAFFDAIAWDYSVRTPYDAPLGGSQSALCYLATHLAAADHQIWLINNGTALGMIDGVEHLNLSQVRAGQIDKLRLDACIVVNDSRIGGAVQDLVGPRVPIALWVHADTDARSTAPLKEDAVAARVGAYVFVSEWQRQRYLASFALPQSKTRVLRHAVAPPFERCLGAREQVLPSMQNPPLLVYTSTPTRGLSLLVDCWPAIRRHSPGARLKVFSSMGVYNMPDSDDLVRLYERCRATPGIEYVGSVSQPVLAREMRGAAVLAYPTRFAETGCIAALEAMASGAVVTTSDHGALSETTNGFGRLIAADQDETRFLARFVAVVCSVLDQIAERDAGLERDLRAQIAFINGRCTWRRRAQDWIDWLSGEIVPMRSDA
jgi:glycosyltransferase involved in cell wall biosynthesis